MTASIPLLSSKGYETLWALSNDDHKLFYENPSSASLKARMEKLAVDNGDQPETLWSGGLNLAADLASLDEADVQSHETDADNAPVLWAALPDLTPSKAADHRLWASVNCFALLQFTTKRWNQTTSGKAPCRTQEHQKLREWVQEHYLGYGSAMKRWNAAARLWWQVEMANRAAPHSKQHSSSRLLVAMANDVEMYHKLLEHPYLASNPQIVAAIYDMVLAGDDYLLRRPYPQRMMQTLNMKAAAVSLGTLSDASLRAAVEEAKPPKGTSDIG